MLIALVLVAGVDLALVRAVRRLLFGLMGIREARFIGPEPPFEVPWRARIGVGVGALVAGYVFLTTVAAIGSALMGGYGTTTAVHVMPGGAAETSGMRTGDVVTSIDGARVERFADIRRAVEAHGPGVMSIVVARGAAEQTLALTPVDGKIGVVATRSSLGPVDALVAGVRFPGVIVEGVLGMVQRSGAELSGPVGIFREVSGATGSPVAALGAALALLLAEAQLLVLPLLLPAGGWSASRRAGRARRP
ncbi:MAG TPA: PDZ domain-containing protein [Byssovorax sp.]|jgi:membrane-associated protease RseP (regulator of RpoE activity)